MVKIYIPIRPLNVRDASGALVQVNVVKDGLWRAERASATPEGPVPFINIFREFFALVGGIPDIEGEEIAIVLESPGFPDPALSDDALTHDITTTS